MSDRYKATNTTVQISITDVAVGMRVRIDTQSSYWPQGWVTYSDHRILRVQLYSSGSIYALQVEPWGHPGQISVVEAKNVLDIRLYTDQEKPKLKHAGVTRGPSL